MSVSLETLSRTELEGLLSELRTFRLLEKKLGKRAKGVLSQARSPDASVRVELSPHTEAKALESVFKKLSIESGAVEFQTNPRLRAGARLFVGDDLYDLSFDAIIQKI